MATEIMLTEGEKLVVSDEYRDVYEKLLGAGWREPCEFIMAGAEHRPVTINPVFVMYLRAA